MAVVITTKFYEEGTPAWHDLAKIVFTSPNMDSPNTAGIRSHILPGQADLGLWYETVSNMYRVADPQDELPTPSGHPIYMGRMNLYSTEEFSFVFDNSVLIDFQSIGDVTIYPDDILYYDKDNRCVVVSTTVVSSGTLDTEDKTITVYDGFFNGRRAGYSYNVYWEATGLYTSDDVDIYYSIDGGITWVNVVTDSDNDGVHTFAIPTTTSLAKLKVVSSATSTVKDESAPFIITDGEFNVISPVTGDGYDGRATHKIWWNCSSFFQDELISSDISFNDGNTWSTLISGIPNTGNAKVNFPVGDSTFTKIKVYSTANPSVVDESGKFTTNDVKALILTPSNTASWRNLQDHKIWWNSNNFHHDELLGVDISYDNGASWQTLSSGVINTGNFTTTLASGVFDATVIRLKSVTEPTVYSYSDVFETHGGGFTTIIPIYADFWYNYRTHKVWWNSAHFYNDENVDISISYDAGVSWTTLVSGIVNTGYAKVTLPVYQSGNLCYIRVASAISGGFVYDTQRLTVCSGTNLNLLYPTNGDIIGNGTIHKIWWNSTNFPWTNVGEYETTNYYNPIYGTITHDAINVASPNHLYDGDINSFTLIKSMTIPSPNEYTLQIDLNNSIVVDELKLITNRNYTGEDIKVVSVHGYSRDGLGGSGCLLSSSGAVPITFVTDDTITYTSTIKLSPNNVAFPIYRFCFGKDQYFGDDLLLSGLHLNGYSADDSMRNKIDVTFSTDNGNSWSVVASGINNIGKADVLIPYDVGSSSTSLIKIRDHRNPTHLLDTNTITVVSGGLDMKWPVSSNGPFIIGDNFYVWWNSDHIYDSSEITVSMSTNSGIDYTVVKDTVENDGTVSFVLDSSITSTAKIKVGKGDGTYGIDDASCLFTTEVPYIDIVMPISGSIVVKSFTVSPPYGTSSPITYTPNVINIYYNTNVYYDKQGLHAYYKYNSTGSFSNIGGPYSNTGVLNDVNITSVVDTDDAVIKLEYTNDNGDIISDVSSEFKVRQAFTSVSDSIQVMPMDYWSSSYKYGDYIYRLSGYENKIYRFSIATNDCEVVASYPEEGITKPYLTIKNGVCYIVDRITFSFYSYSVADGIWRVLTQTPGEPKCLKSTTDSDNYIYTVAGKDWYRYNVVAGGAWAYIYAFGDGTTENYAVWKGDVITLSGTGVGTTYFSRMGGDYDSAYVYYSDLAGNAFFIPSISTWNPDDKGTNISLSDENTRASWGEGTISALRGTMGKSTGKWYWEVKVTAMTANIIYIGVGTAEASLGINVGLDVNGYGYYANNGKAYHAGASNSYGAAYFYDTIGTALDLDNGKIWWSINGVWQNSGDPTVGTNPAFSAVTGTLYAMASHHSHGCECVVNFGASAFEYASPNGFIPGFGSLVKPVVSGDLSVSTGIAQSGSKVLAFQSVSKLSSTNGTTAIMCCDVDSAGTFITDTAVTVNSTDAILETNNSCGADNGNMDIVEYNEANKCLLHIDVAEAPIVDKLSCDPLNYESYTKRATIINYLGDISYLNKEISIRSLDGGAVYYNNSIYIPGGAYSLVPYYEYNTVSGTYSFPTTSFSVNNSNGDILCVDGTYVYKLCGRQSNLFYKCHIVTGVTTQLTSVPASLGELPSVCYNSGNNKIYLSIDKDALSSLWVYSISGNSWLPTATMPHTVDDSFVISDDTFVYVVEARNGGFLRYNTASDTWISLASFPDNDYETICYAGHSGGSIYCYSYTGGAGSEVISVYRYDFTTNTWGLFVEYLYAVAMEGAFTQSMYSIFTYGIDYDSINRVTGAISPDYFYTLVNSKTHCSYPMLAVGNTLNADRSGIYRSDLPAFSQYSWSAPTDRMQDTSPGGWVAPVSIPYSSSAPLGWVAPEAHPTLEPTPGHWVAPIGPPSVESEPAGWVAPIDASLEGQPVDWLAPIAPGDREPEVPTLTPITSGPPIIQVPYVVNIELSNIVGTKVIKGSDSDSLYLWNRDVTKAAGETWAGADNCIVFETTTGNAYDCRLTAWDDTTHSTTVNELLLRDSCRVYTLAFSSNSSITTPYNEGFTLYEFVAEPVENKILKGNISYYGDFQMKYRYQSNVYGDYLVFRPLLYGIDDTMPYGVHDFVITLHYSYT